ncbi:MAG: aldo/keto reductase [candidate division WS1 bacterium]|jgi:voltage-dependent potassium channel beta subunit|nr:aldo/keto reductase [candidate division WS1 bacterium]
MQYRNLGKWGVKLSTIGLGSYLTIGMHVDDETAAECVKVAFDGGINWIDTANAYNRGGAEIALGKILRDYDRDDYVLATKVWAPMGDGANDRGLSAKHVYEQCHASLKRLQTDYIDLYQCHRPDPETPLEETIRIMDDLARAGKILYWGVSEWPAALIQEACDLAKMMGARPPVSNQPRYSLLYREPEEQVFPTCLHNGLGNVVFSPLAHGVLTGKYEPGQAPPEGTRAADDTQNKIMMDMYFSDEQLRTVQTMKEMAGDLGLTCAQLAIAWCLQHPAVTSVISGVTRASQLEDNLGAAEAEIPADVLSALDRMFPAGPESKAP